MLRDGAFIASASAVVLRSQPPASPVFCSSDKAAASLFVELTAATATRDAAWNWLIANVARCLPADYDVAFDIVLDVAAVRCTGIEWWTVESQPANGPAPDARQLWRFDVTEALTLTPVGALDVVDDPWVPPDALDALAVHWHAGRVSDGEYERLLVLAEGQAAALSRHAERRGAAPATAPRVELKDDERDAVMVLTAHVARLLIPSLADEDARAQLRAGLRELELQSAGAASPRPTTGQRS